MRPQDRKLSRPLYESTIDLVREVAAFDERQRANAAAWHKEYPDAEQTPKEHQDTDAREHPTDFWVGGVTYEKAMEMAVKGWPEGLPNMREALKLARAPYEHSVQYEMPADVQGSVVDPGAFFAGVPEAFHTPAEVSTVQLGYDGVEIVYNSFVSCSVDSEVIYARGATAVLLAHVCAMSSIPCRIVQGFTTKEWANYNGEIRDVAVVLNDWDDPIDFPKIAYWMCHPSATRRVGFRLLDMLCHDAGAYRMDRRGYGSCINTCYAGGDRFKRIVINHGLARSGLMNPQTAIDEIIKLLLKEEKVTGEGVEV